MVRYSFFQFWVYASPAVNFVQLQVEKKKYEEDIMQSQAVFESEKARFDNEIATLMLNHEVSVKALEQKLNVALAEKQEMMQTCRAWNEKCAQVSQDYEHFMKAAEQTKRQMQKECELETERKVVSMKV